MNNINKNYIIIAVVAVIICIVILIYIFSLNQKDYNNYEDLEITSTEEENIEETEEKEKIKVHIAGSVVSEGIIELEEGARVADAIDKVGGTTPDANMNQVNLAYKLEDGQKIYIPNQNEEEYKITEGMEGIQTNEDINKNNELININTATQTELELLPGIGPSTATKIIDYREENGEFETIDDIKNVPGIGEAKYETIKNSITV